MSQELLSQLRQLRQQQHSAQALELGREFLASEPELEEPERLALYFELGSNALSLGYWQSALDYLLPCTQLVSPPSGLQHRLGRASQELGQLEAARAYFEAAIALKNPTQAGKSWHQLGRVYEQQAKRSEAISSYQQAMQCFEQMGQKQELGISAFQLGRLHQQQQDWFAAQKCFEQARQFLASQADMRAEACYRLGEMAIQLKQPQQAEAVLGEALSIHRHLAQKHPSPKHAAALGMTLLKLCQVLMLQKRWKEVIATVRQAIEALEGSGEVKALQLAYELQGELLQLMGKYDEGQLWLDKAKALAPEA